MPGLQRSASTSSLQRVAAELPRKDWRKPAPLPLKTSHVTPNIPNTYVSLPSTPVSSPTPKPTNPNVTSVPFSLWDYLREELLATDFDSHQEMKWERVSNFLHIPFALEKVRK